MLEGAAVPKAPVRISLAGDPQAARQGLRSRQCLQGLLLGVAGVV